jgi:hypothetical protein
MKIIAYISSVKNNVLYLLKQNTMGKKFSCIPNPYIVGEFIIESEDGIISLRMSEALFADDDETKQAIDFILSKLNA